MRSRYTLLNTSETIGRFKVTLKRLLNLGVRRYVRADKKYFKLCDLKRLARAGTIQER
jgi:hypothetical protein